MNLKLRLIYSFHMLAPIALVARHIERLSPETARALHSLFS
jgi:hypothetical protein